MTTIPERVCEPILLMHATTGTGKETQAARCIVAENVTGGWHTIVFQGDPAKHNLSLLHRSDRAAETPDQAIALIPSIISVDRHQQVRYRWSGHSTELFQLADAMAGLRTGH